jgi:hypothetical protein
LDAFTAGGGVVIKAGKAEPGIAAHVEAAAGGPRLSLEPRGHVLGQLTRKPDDRTFILHLLNYDHQITAKNVKVRLDLSGLVQDLSRWEVKVLSPDAAQPQLTGLSLHRGVSEFTLGRIEHYAIVTLSDRPRPLFYRLRWGRIWKRQIVLAKSEIVKVGINLERSRGWLHVCSKRNQRMRIANLIASQVTASTERHGPRPET